jgi:hypothetical protein
MEEDTKLIIFLIVFGIALYLWYITFVKPVESVKKAVSGAVNTVGSAVSGAISSVSGTVSGAVSSVSQGYENLKKQTENSITNTTQQTLVDLISGKKSTADIINDMKVKQYQQNVQEQLKFQQQIEKERLQNETINNWVNSQASIGSYITIPQAQPTKILAGSSRGETPI